MADKTQLKEARDFTFCKTSNEDTGSFINERGLKMFCKYWSKDVQSPRGLVFICHGAAEHVGPYNQLAEQIKEQNYFVFGHDHQGHGQSEGDRVHITDFRHYVIDVFAHCDRIKQDFPDLPIFIVGHSMGGAVTVLSGIDRPNFFTGLVLIGPVTVNDQNQVGPVTIFFGKLMARILPQFPVMSLNPKAISRDPKVVEDYTNDKLNYHGAMKAKWATCVLQSAIEIESKLDKIEFPYLCIHGEADGLVKCSGSRTFFEKTASKDKTLTVYPEAYHQLHLDIEPDASKSRQEIVDWIVSHTK